MLILKKKLKHSIISNVTAIHKKILIYKNFSE